jgi:hypothetical protein
MRGILNLSKHDMSVTGVSGASPCDGLCAMIWPGQWSANPRRIQ